MIRLGLSDVPRLRDWKYRPLVQSEVLAGIGPGWHPLVERLIREAWLAGWNGEVTQVKEKFGGLRFYIGAASDEVHDLIRAAEAASFRICDQCGRPGRTRLTGWIRTLCWIHYFELRLRRARPWWLYRYSWEYRVRRSRRRGILSRIWPMVDKEGK